MSSLDSQTAGGLIPPLTLAGTSTPLAHQVAGHQNVRADASGSLVIKVCSQLPFEYSSADDLAESTQRDCFISDGECCPSIIQIGEVEEVYTPILWDITFGGEDG